MRFLRVLGLAGIVTWLFRHVVRAKAFANRVAGSSDRFRSHLHAVGTHIGDETGGFAANVHAFIKALRHLHGAGC
ncbi:hypothetical protein D9M69_713530 [compost metagenome]